MKFDQDLCENFRYGKQNSTLGYVVFLAMFLRIDVSVHFHLLKAWQLVIQLLAVLQEISNSIFLDHFQIY